MERIVIIIVAIFASVATYFWGMQNGQQQTRELQRHHANLQKAEMLSEQIQYQTLLKLGKTDELNVLLKSRILTEKAMLEGEVARGNNKSERILKDAIEMAELVLNSESN